LRPKKNISKYPATISVLRELYKDEITAHKTYSAFVKKAMKEKYISACAWEAGFPEDIIVMPIAISIDAVKHGPIRESVFIKSVYREGVII